MRWLRMMALKVSTKSGSLPYAELLRRRVIFLLRALKIGTKSESRLAPGIPPDPTLTPAAPRGPRVRDEPEVAGRGAGSAECTCSPSSFSRRRTKKRKTGRAPLGKRLVRHLSTSRWQKRPRLAGSRSRSESRKSDRVND